MSKTKEDYLNQLKGLQQVQAIKQELKHKYLQICSKNYNDRELIIDCNNCYDSNFNFHFICMYNNLKNEERQLNDFVLKIDAHAKFYEGTKESLNKEEQQAQLLFTKKLVNEWMEWNERSVQKQH